MTMTLAEQYNLRSHLDVYWLRPESAYWDAIAAKYLSDHLIGKTDIFEIGIGNGYFSFLMLGGRFKASFDWFHNIATEGFWENEDIYDHDSNISMVSFIERKPNTRIKVAVDHKQALLNQASRLGFVDSLVQHDCNQPIPVSGFHTVYSNMLYWLNDPLRVMDEVGCGLPKGGELITVFPNSGFYQACRSYTSAARLWKFINRGRADHIMWHMDIAEFEKEIARRGVFDLTYFQRYLSPTTLRIWDVGLRPLSVPLIKMANALVPEKRLEIKQEWCDTLLRFADPLLTEELEHGDRDGGFTLVKLIKK